MPFVEVIPEDFVVVMSMHRALNRATRVAMEGSLTDFRVLACISAHSGAYRSANICRDLNLSRSTTSMAMGRLMAREQIVYQGEGWSKRVAVTDFGRNILAATYVALDATTMQEAPKISSANLRTHEHLMVALADRLGAHILVREEVDMVLVNVEVCSRTERIIRKNAADYGLTANGFLVLAGLVGWDTPLQPSELSERLRLPKPLVTPACKQLISKGLAFVRLGENDARTKLVLATPDGRDLLQRSVTSFWTKFSLLSRPLTDEEFAFFRSIHATDR